MLAERLMFVSRDHSSDAEETTAIIPIGRSATSVYFVHSAAGTGRIREPFGPRQVIGRYRIEYADSGVAVQEVAFGHHVAEWNRRHGEPMGARFHRHAGYVATWPCDPFWQGKTSTGEDITIYLLEWTNPRPDSEIGSITIEAAEADADVALLVLAITLVG